MLIRHAGFADEEYTGMMYNASGQAGMTVAGHGPQATGDLYSQMSAGVDSIGSYAVPDL
jgi:hypothetical protein